MLSERPWNRELLLLFVAGLLISWCLGILISILLEQFLPVDAVAAKSFYRFIISTLSFHGATVVLLHQFLKLHGMTWKEFLGLATPQIKRALLFGVIMGILVLPVVLLLNDWSGRFLNSLGTKPVPQTTIKVLESTVGFGQRLCFGVAAIVLAPIAEEALFRGILYPYLKQRGRPVLAFFGTSLLFAAVHGNLGTFLPLTFLAFVLIFIYEKTDKLLAPILAHALFNGVNFTLFIVQTQRPHWFN